MNFEKAYEEALAKAREIHRNEKGERFDMEWIFPELAGSEDERIRKEIIQFIKKRDRSGCDYDYDQWLAYLEKQGEQKPIEWDEYDEMYVSALIAIVRKEDATTQNLRDTLTGWLRCLKGRFEKNG
jgi:hypothetical protein